MAATGTEVLLRLMSQLHHQRITLHFSGMKLPVEKMLLSAGALAPQPWLHLYRTDGEAIEALRRLNLPPAAPDPSDLPGAAI